MSRASSRNQRQSPRSMQVMIVVLAVLVFVGAGCSSEDDVSTDTTETGGTATSDDGEAAGDGANGNGDGTESTESPTTAAEPTDTAEPTGTTGTGTTGDALALGQAVIWPAPGEGTGTPEEAGESFVTTVLGVPAVLGEFRQGDARSGEIDVFSPGEGEGAVQILRGVLLLRQLGPADAWYVIAAENENAAITTPLASATVEAGPLTVGGAARGFEASVVVTAQVVGGEELDQQLTQGGAFETPEPYSVSVDLSGAAPGDYVMLLVRGGTGLETDPGDFGAIPVVIG